MLCGYYVAEQNISEKVVREFLKQALPPYMIPAYIIRLDKMPYTINRKIDRKALPLPEKNVPHVKEKIDTKKHKEIKMEGLETNEEILLEVWKKTLKLDNIGLDDNFFDIGGDSIAAIDVQIASLKYGLNFEYSDIFNFPTIRELAHKLPEQKDDFLETYDYKIVNKVLERNNSDNIKNITKVNPGNILITRRNRIFRFTYCICIFKTKQRRYIFLN